MYKIILFVAIIAISIVLIAYFYSKPDSKVTPLLGGIATGMLVAVLQLLLMWTEHNQIENIMKLGIKNILPYRDDKNFYENVIKGTKKEIRVLGSTASRF